jgi:hypothetical protein
VNPSEPIVPGAEPAAPTVREVVPQDYEELKAFRASFEEKVLPYWDDLKPILEDEDARTFTRSALETYRDRQKRQEPEISPELQPLVSRFEKDLGPIVEYVNADRAAKAEAKAAADREVETQQKAAFAANKAYAERIMAERADFRNADGFPSPMMEDLIILAAQRKMSIEDAYKEYGPRYFGVKPQAVQEPREKRPPTSLRGDAAAPGVPGESTAPKPQSQKERLARMRANMVAAGGRG